MTKRLSRNDTVEMSQPVKVIAPLMSLTLIETERTGTHGATREAHARLRYSADNGFLAHLLAVRHDAPELRRLRRAGPAQAIAAYANSVGKAATGAACRLGTAA